MRVRLIPSMGSIEAIIKHSEICTLDTPQHLSHWMVEDPRQEGMEELPGFNTCVGIRRLCVDKEARTKTFGFLNIHPKPTVSTIYALFNGEKFSDWLEVSFSTRFMNNEVGPNGGFITGVGLKPKMNIFEALPDLGKVQEFLKDIGYRGEVLASLAEDYTVCDLTFGHLYGHWGLFCEACKGSVDGLLGFLAGDVTRADLHETIVVANVVSRSPFPMVLPIQSPQILAPQSAEKHLWRIRNLSLSYVLVTVHGQYLNVARNRLRRTIDNMLESYSELQYRTDYGIKGKFLLCQEEYQHLAEMRYSPKAQKFSESALPQLPEDPK